MRTRSYHLVFATIGVVACAGDPVVGPSPATELQVVSGGGQQGTPGYRLENEVVVRLLDERGNGVAGATIAFSSEDQYAVAEPSTVVTDSTGAARTWWRLGATLGRQELAARYDALPSARIQAAAVSMPVRNVTGSVGRFCVLDVEGVLSCGRGPELGAANPPPRIPAPGNLRFSEFVISNDAVGCGVAGSGRVWCLTLSDINAPFASFQELAGGYPPLHGLSTSSDAAAGFCGLSSAGQAYCWGANTANRFGQTFGVNPPTPTAVGTSQPFASIVLGPVSTCALTADGTPWCWGSNNDGLAGQPSPPIQNRVPPAPMVTSLKFSRIVLDNEVLTGCGFALSGGFWCWGTGYPELRVGTFSEIVGHLPQRMSGVEGLKDASAVGENLASLHGGGSVTSTLLNFRDIGYVVFRAGDFGGYPMREFFSGPFRDLVCGGVEGGVGALCRAIPEQIRPVASAPSTPGVGAFGIPPQ